MAEALQLIVIPHRPVHLDSEINADLARAFDILHSAPGLQGMWRGKKFEDRYTQVALLLWEDLTASHAFFISSAYHEFHRAIQPAMNGRRIEWQNHAILDRTGLDNSQHLRRVLESPAIEVAWTKVVEGGVSGYYDRFKETVVPILNEDPGCDGHFISPTIENPQDQMLLINWKSVDAHHEEFEKRPTFSACINALKDYYPVFVVPWHIVELRAVRSEK